MTNSLRQAWHAATTHHRASATFTDVGLLLGADTALVSFEGDGMVDAKSRECNKLSETVGRIRPRVWRRKSKNRVKLSKSKTLSHYRSLR